MILDLRIELEARSMGLPFASELLTSALSDLEDDGGVGREAILIWWREAFRRLRETPTPEAARSILDGSFDPCNRRRT
jgi:hypothetical protein